MRFIAVALLIGTVALTVAAGAPSTVHANRPAPHYSDPSAVGKRLVLRFFALIQKKDVAGLETFLSPAFQVQRADGSSSDKAAYLKNLPTVEKFSISKLAATQAGPVLVVRYLARATGLVNGKPYTPGNAPRLSSFVWNSDRWQLVAHANFNPLTG